MSLASFVEVSLDSIKKIWFWIISFDAIWAVPALSLFLVYGFSSIYGIFYFRTSIAIEFLGILILAGISYFLSYFLLKKYLPSRNYSFPFLKSLNTDWIIGLVCLAYFIVIGYALVTSEKIAIVESLRGANGEEIGLAREMLFKARVGPERFLVYANALISSAFLPFAVCMAFLEKKKYRFVLLILISISLIPSLEKAALMKIYLPLIILGMNRYISLRTTLILAGILLVFIFGAAKLTKAGHMSASSSLVELEKSSENFGFAASETSVFKSLLSEAPQADVHRFELVSAGNPFGFIINRTFWIPYITAYDWLVFSKNFLKSELLTGRTSSTVSALTGQSHVDMDKAVFAMEFTGGKIVCSGSANAVYLVDAFVNFSWLGVLVAAFLVALVTRFLEISANPAFLSCYYYYLFVLSGGSLFGVLFSNGMSLFLGMVIFFPRKTFQKEP